MHSFIPNFAIELHHVKGKQMSEYFEIVVCTHLYVYI